MPNGSRPKRAGTDARSGAGSMQRRLAGSRAQIRLICAPSPAERAPLHARAVVPVHADCHRGNWLACDRSVTALLDFEWAGQAPRAHCGTGRLAPMAGWPARPGHLSRTETAEGGRLPGLARVLGDEPGPALTGRVHRRSALAAPTFLPLWQVVAARMNVAEQDVGRLRRQIWCSGAAWSIGGCSPRIARYS